MCIDRMHELKALGLRTFLDPCPIDLGRDVELMAEVAQATGVHIICATGLYKEDQGATPYFKFRAQFSDAVTEMSEAFITELTDGIGSTGIKPGILKGGHASRITSRHTRRWSCAPPHARPLPPTHRSRRTPTKGRWAVNSSTSWPPKAST